VKPGGSDYDSISLDISAEIFNKLPSGTGGFGGFSLVAETKGKPYFIHHEIDDASASKTSSGFISKCTLNIFVKIYADNGTREGEYTYDVDYILQGGLLLLHCQYTVDVRQAKPQWVVEGERSMQQFGSIIGITMSSVLFLIIPSIVLIRKIRRPSYSRGTLTRRRAVLGIAVALFGVLGIASYISILLANPQGNIDSLGYLPPFITYVGFLLISAVIFMP